MQALSKVGICVSMDFGQMFLSWDGGKAGTVGICNNMIGIYDNHFLIFKMLQTFSCDREKFKVIFVIRGCVLF